MSDENQQSQQMGNGTKPTTTTVTTTGAEVVVETPQIEKENQQEQVDVSERLKKEEFVYCEEALQKYIEENSEEYEKNLANSVGYASAAFTFVKKIRIGSDITKIAMPAFLLRPVSYLELQCDNSVPSTDLLQIRSPKYNIHPIQRMLCVTKTLLYSFEKTPEKGFERCKPINPIYGEFFEASFKHFDENQATVGETYSIVEQVGDHRTMSAMFMMTPSLKLVYDSTTRIQTTFGITGVPTRIKGYHAFTLLGDKENGEDDEVYKCSFPAVVIKVGLTGSTAMEYGDMINIECKKTGISVQIDCKSGNHYSGYMYQQKQKVMYIEGSWKKGSTYSFVSGKDKNKQKVLPLVSNIEDYHSKQKVTLKKVVKPLHEQNDCESRKVWHNVIKSLRTGLKDEAEKYKNEIEDSQSKLSPTSSQERFFALSQCEPRNSSDGIPIYRIKKREQLLKMIRNGSGNPIQHSFQEIWNALP